MLKTISGVRRRRLAASLLLTAQNLVHARPVRISAWSVAERGATGRGGADFRNMPKLGFTDVDLGWGLDTAALALRVDDTNYYALRACRRAG
jgi:hypothetical protein